MNTDKFERTRHIRYFTNCLQSLPEQYAAADTNRLTLVHFCVQSLDILGCLPTPNCCGKVDKEVNIDTKGIIEWIYGLQTIPTLTENNDERATYIGGGFKGGTYLGDIASCRKDDITCPQQYSVEEERVEVVQHPYDHSHLAMTYVGICTLLALGDDLSRVHKTAILQTLTSLQKDDGSFIAISSSNDCNNEQNEKKEDDDCDLRFLYTAISIWYLLKSNDNDDDNPIINIETATNYILSCITYDGSLGLTPGREGHGGSTFCGLASLYLMDVLDDVMNRRVELKGWKDDLIRWCVSRQYPLHGTIYSNTIEHNGSTNQVAGMCGRPNKLEDTCYSYWVGGTLHLLNESHLLDGWALRDYVLSCQSTYGGFGKLVGAMPDVLHSFYSLAWLSLSVEQGCCDDEEDEYVNDIDKDDKNNKQTSKAYDTESRQQVDESLHQLSRLDCALGICSKRIQALQKRQER